MKEKIEALNTPNEALTKAIEQHQSVVASMSKLNGRKIYTPVVKNLDPLYNKKKNENERPLIPYFPFRMYALEKIMITKVEYDQDANGSLYAMLNGEASLRFEITTPGLHAVTPKTIKEAIQNYERNTGRPYFFTDGIKAQAEIDALNTCQYEWINQMLKELTTQAAGLKQAMEIDAARMIEDKMRMEAVVETTVLIEESGE